MNKNIHIKDKNYMIITIITLNITEGLNIIDRMTGDKLIIEEENHHLDHKAGDVE
jgi:hypothetical protein